MWESKEAGAGKVWCWSSWNCQRACMQGPCHGRTQHPHPPAASAASARALRLPHGSPTLPSCGGLRIPHLPCRLFPLRGQSGAAATGTPQAVSCAKAAAARPTQPRRRKLPPALLSAAATWAANPTRGRALSLLAPRLCSQHPAPAASTRPTSIRPPCRPATLTQGRSRRSARRLCG